MNYTKSLVRGSGIVFVVTILAAILGYILRILLARNLTIEEYRESFIKQSILELQIQPIISISHTEELYEIKNNSNNEGLKLFRKNKKSSQKKNIKNVMDLEINKD